MAVDGSLIFDTKVDTKGFESGKKTIQKSANSLKSSITKLGAAIGVAFGVKQLVAFSAQAVETASDLQEVQNVVDTAFGDMAYKMEEFADKAVETYGISKLTAKQTGSTFMAMAKGMGLATSASSDMSIALTGLSADMASFYNVEQSVASTALKSIFTGETETLKQFGVVMTETNLQEFARQQGITKAISKMSQAEKVQLRYNYVMKQTALAQGDFAKTSDGWANQTRILSERWKEFKGTIGNALMAGLLPVIQRINSAMSALISYATQASNALMKLFGIENKTGNTEKSIAKSTALTADNYSDIAESSEITAEANDSTLASFDEINKISDDNSGDGGTTEVMNSFTETPSSKQSFQETETEKKLNGILGIVQRIKEAWESFRNAFSLGFDKINFDAIRKNFLSTFENMKSILSSFVNGAKTIFVSLSNFIGTILGNITSIFGKVLEIISGAFNGFFSENKEKITNWISETSNKIAHGFDNLSFSANVIFGALWNALDENEEEIKSSTQNIIETFSNAFMLIGTIISDIWNGATEEIKKWTDENEAKIQNFFGKIIQTVLNIWNTVTYILDDIFATFSEWWETKMKPVWDKIVAAVLGVADTLMLVWTSWILPIINKIAAWAKDLWDKHLKKLYTNVLNFISSVGDFITTLWSNILKPIVDWLIGYLKPKIMFVVNVILSIASTLIGYISDVVGGIIKSLGGILDFLTGIFQGDWEKAWNGIKNFVGGIWDAIWGGIKATINLIIDGLNALWGGVYSVFAGIVDGIGGAIGWVGDLFGKDWGFSMPSEPPLIPKLATGTVVPASYGEFLAVLGDNKREPEVVSPLSTIEQAVRNAMSGFNGQGGDITIPVYIGTEKIDEIVVSAQRRQRIMGGGY